MHTAVVEVVDLVDRCVGGGVLHEVQHEFVTVEGEREVVRVGAVRAAVVVELGQQRPGEVAEVVVDVVLERGQVEGQLVGFFGVLKHADGPLAVDERGVVRGPVDRVAGLEVPVVDGRCVVHGHHADGDDLVNGVLVLSTVVGQGQGHVTRTTGFEVHAGLAGHGQHRVVDHADAEERAGLVHGHAPGVHLTGRVVLVWLVLDQVQRTAAGVGNVREDHGHALTADKAVFWDVVHVSRVTEEHHGVHTVAVGVALADFRSIVDVLDDEVDRAVVLKAVAVGHGEVELHHTELLGGRGDAEVVAGEGPADQAFGGHRRVAVDHHGFTFVDRPGEVASGVLHVGCVGGQGDGVRSGVLVNGDVRKLTADRRAGALDVHREHDVVGHVDRIFGRPVNGAVVVGVLDHHVVFLRGRWHVAAEEGAVGEHLIVQHAVLQVVGTEHHGVVLAEVLQGR